ncbi:MAG: hypothetical protein ACR2F6_04270 [Mycobacteriales bacterium]
MRDCSTMLPIYGLADWPGPVMIGDWGWENGRLVTVGIAHGDPTGDGPAVQVATTVHDPGTAVASLRMASAEAARHEDDALRRQHEADVAPSGQVDLLVDSAPVRFELWNAGDRWWAATAYAGYGLVVEARRTAVGPLALVRVHDIEPYFAGRRASLRARRDEA